MGEPVCMTEQLEDRLHPDVQRIEIWRTLVAITEGHCRLSQIQFRAGSVSHSHASLRTAFDLWALMHHPKYTHASRAHRQGDLDYLAGKLIDAEEAVGYDYMKDHSQYKQDVAA